jgi:hypothetical protein
VLGIGVGRAQITVVSLLEGTPTRLPGSPGVSLSAPGAVRHENVMRGD